MMVFSIEDRNFLRTSLILLGDLPCPHPADDFGTYGVLSGMILFKPQWRPVQVSRHKIEHICPSLNPHPVIQRRVRILCAPAHAHLEYT